MSIVNCQLSIVLMEYNNDINKNCIKESSPLVSILLAVYKPNEEWLVEQLVSLNEQTYENLELLIYDDCPEFPVNEEYFKKYITNFNYALIRGEKNRGSNMAFEELTQLGNGEFFAYCDQDDIWELEKIELMIDKFEEDVTLTYSDLCIIDENGIKKHNSLKDIRKRIVYKSGYDLANGLLMANFVTGCAMIVRKDIAIKAIPFEESLVHDQWIAIIAAINGKIQLIDRPLVRYRQHSSNQTGILKTVFDKDSYYEKRILFFLKRYESLRGRFKNNEELLRIIDNYLAWINARRNYFINKTFRDFLIMIKYRKFHKGSIFLEILLPIIPNNTFKRLIRILQKGFL
ncbi:glycosyltransferase [Clostridium carnis]|uniref:Glycosyltransferase n=1 Tax=Clostridium carnis TaxID=1530 RepID=A0ABY6SPT6_9CLOT|nr:glycosyltransferase [Clostridium carnis]VDG69867.1 glycosyltransferase [Clostridium carnis]